MYYQPKHMTGDHHHTYKNSHSPKIIRKILLILLALSIVIYPWLIEPKWIDVEYTSLVCPDLSSAVGQLRVVYLSDIHYGSNFSRAQLEDLVSQVNALNPDIVLLGGDYANDSAGAISFFQTLPAFHARYAVCAVLGDADRTEPDSNFPILKDAIRQAGVNLLNNSVYPIRIGTGTTIYIAGIDDPLNGMPDIEATAAQVKSDDFVIFMSHSPSVISKAQQAESADHHRSWFDLGLFGHTHGGQISLLAGLMPMTDSISVAHYSGWVNENRVNMLISNGIGTSGLPLRFLRRPQIHVITITNH